jgi:hypothetical protein
MRPPEIFDEAPGGAAIPCSECGEVVYITTYQLSLANCPFCGEPFGVRATRESVDGLSLTPSAQPFKPITRQCPMCKGDKVGPCVFTFRSSACGYSGSEPECDKVASTCRRLGNLVRFGGVGKCSQCAGRGFVMGR